MQIHRYNNRESKVAIPDASIDVVVISETHIAEQVIGPEEKAIFADIVPSIKTRRYFCLGQCTSHIGLEHGSRIFTNDWF